MTYALAWSYASETDLPELQNFICTDAPALPGTADDTTVDDPWWESDIEIGIQEIDFPLQSSREYMLIARDDHGIAGVVWCWEQAGPRRVKILGIAVAQRLRGQGLCLGDELLERGIQEVMGRADAAEIEVASAYARVHPYNRNSLELFQRHRFFHAPDTSDGYCEMWLRIDLPRQHAE